MKTTVVFDSKSLELNLSKMQKQMPQLVDRALIQTAQHGSSVILGRTKRGVGYTGNFAPYTPEYRKRKAEGWKPTNKTRGFGGAPSTPVNLNLRGEMLGSMASTMVKRGVAKIYFTRASEAKKAAFNDAKRPFFGFNASEQNKLRKFFFNRVKI